MLTTTSMATLRILLYDKFSVMRTFSNGNPTQRLITTFFNRCISIRGVHTKVNKAFEEKLSSQEGDCCLGFIAV